MIRWKFILTRAIVVVAVILLLRYTLSPIAKYLTVRAIEAATGAKVEIAKTRVGLFPPSIRYEGLQVADPRGDKSMQNAFSAEAIDLEIDGDAFLHRRYVVRDSSISGLKIGSDRLESGHYTAEHDAETEAGSEWLSTFFGSLANSSEEKLEAFGKGLEMVKRGDQIRRRWKGEYASLLKRAAELETSIKQLRDTAKSVDNPLRDWPRIEAAMAKSKEIQKELVAVRAAIDAIPAQVQQDLASMEKAKQADIAKVEEITSFDFSSADKFGPRLLADVVNRQVDRMRVYVDRGREIADWTVAAPSVERERGETIDLIRGKHLPSMLIRRCEVNGELSAEGNPYQLTGILENLTDQPKLREAPFRARLKLAGPQEVRVDYVRDESKDIAKETMTLHFPNIQAPKMSFGDSDNLALDVTNGRMEVWAQLDLSGETLQGRLVSRRVETNIDLRTSPKIAQTAIITNLKNTLADVDRVEVDASFTGTWSDMDISISTNLTQILKTGIDQAVAAQISETRQQLTAKLGETYQTQMADLQTFVSKEQTEARKLLAKADATIQEFSEKVLGESGAADVYLGRLRGIGLK